MCVCVCVCARVCVSVCVCVCVCVWVCVWVAERERESLCLTGKFCEQVSQLLSSCVPLSFLCGT